MDRTLVRVIKNIVQEELRYFRHYDGEVVDNQDPVQKGRVRVKIAALGQDTNDKGIWARPRQLHALDVPKVGEILDVYFVEGDRTRLVYLANSAENQGNIPEAYTDPSIRILYQDPDTSDLIKYDVQNKKLTYTVQGITIEADGTANVLTAKANNVTVKIDSAAGITIDGSAGTLAIKNSLWSLKTLLDELCGDLQGATTIPAVPGSPLTFNPATIAQFVALQVKIDALLS